MSRMAADVADSAESFLDERRFQGEAALGSPARPFCSPARSAPCAPPLA